MLFDIFITLFNNRLLWFRIIFILLNGRFRKILSFTNFEIVFQNIFD